jgi:DNA helicase II / ATP-dependent DNA helicase PcrA
VGEDARVTVGDAEALLDGLDPQQRAVAEAVHGPVVVIAGAGSGKTRALTRRIAYGVAVGAYDASGMLAVTFTTRAANEMRQRLAALGVGGVATRTFHSAALAQVRYLWPRVYGRSFPEVHPDPTGLLAQLASRADVTAAPRDLATEISWAKVTNVAPDRYVERASAAQRRVAGVDAAGLSRLYSAYVDALARADQVDLEDVLLAAVGTLSTQPAAARVVRQRYRWFTVDEFQDVSPLQLRLLECWLGDRDDVCVVGDPRQSIYAFAGARASLLATMHTRFPRATRLHLSHNYRSTPQVLDVASAVAGDAVLHVGGPGVDRSPPEAASATSALPEPRSTRPDGRRVRLVEAEDQVAEAHEVVRLVSELLAEGLPQNAVAVLTRTQAQASALLRALAGRSIPVSTPGATTFYARPEVAQAMALLAAAVRREQRGSVTEGPLGDVVRGVLGDAGWTEEGPGAQQASSRW